MFFGFLDLEEWHSVAVKNIFIINTCAMTFVFLQGVEKFFKSDFVQSEGLHFTMFF